MSRTALFRRLARPLSAIVVTPNRRLARALGREFDGWQLAQGRGAWETPRVLPFTAFVAQLHDAAQHDPSSSGVRAPLSTAQEQAVWEAVVEASAVPLASPARAAALAADAWLLAHQWRIAGRLRPHALTEDTRLFVEWASDYEQRVERMGATDQARLADVVCALVAGGSFALKEDVLLVAFDELTPQQDALFRTLTERGTRVERIESERAAGECLRVEAADARDELARIADWAAGRLAANPTARIGIVVPDLGARRRAVTRALDAALAPDALLAASDRPRPYTVSLGGSFADVPPVAAALRILRLAVGDVEFAEASALLRSPYVGFGPASERARFDLEWRRHAGRSVTLAQLIAAGRPRHEELRTAPLAPLEALAAWRGRIGSRVRRPSEWAALLMEALRAAGFPGPGTPDSTEYQALARWRELMAEFATLDRVQGPLDVRVAVARLARLATNTVFQPEGGDAPVQVLGLLEANGLEFDHLWLAGMTAEGWPLPVRAHPFLPLALQRAHRMPGALVELELQRASATLDRLARSAPEVLASHARAEGDRVLEPAPMISAWNTAPRMPPVARALDVIVPTTLEVLADAFAPALPASEVVGGGVATLTDQAACPFRAFATHRLRADEPEQPHDGLDASERGELVHRVLAAFWQSLPERNRSFVAAMPPDEFAAKVERAADQAIARMRERRLAGVGVALLSLERRRLVNLASQWLAFEVGARGEFEVRSTEERRSLAIGRLALNGRLDRVDRLPDGRSIVIDYKTGGPASPRVWLGPRPDQPQLPLYLIASETDARAVAFARVRAGEQRFVALAEDASMLPMASVDWQGDYPSWTALVQAWRDELTRLADAFADGVAEVAPKRPDTCRHCGLALLCRHDERVGEVEEDDATYGELSDE